MTERLVVATSAAYRYDRRRRPALGAVVRHQLALTGKDAPKVAYLGTALAEDPVRNAMALAALADAGARPSVLNLYPWPSVDDVTDYLCSQDAVWVGGGSVVNLLALWRAHGVDVAMRAAWEAGVVLGGVSAGSLCWHVGGTTDSYGPDLRLVDHALGLLPHSNTPHYDSEEQRRPLYQSLVADGSLPAGWATDDGVGLVFRGTELDEVVAELPDRYAWRVEPDGEGGARETRVEPRLLEASPA